MRKRVLLPRAINHRIAALLCLSGLQSNVVAASALRENGRVTVDIPVRVQSCQSTISAFVMNADGDIVHVRR